jgi:hypothetical protein
VSNLREAYAATGYASLEWDDNHEKAVDRVAAAGKASKLGMDLWRCKYMNSSVAYHAVSKGLLALFKARYPAEATPIAWKCVEEALSEFLGPACASCNGAKEMILDELRIECQTCKGTGIRRYSDRDRSGRMRVSMAHVRILSGKLEWLGRELGSLDRAVNSAVARELERGEDYHRDLL